MALSDLATLVTHTIGEEEEGPSPFTGALQIFLRLARWMEEESLARQRGQWTILGGPLTTTVAILSLAS